MGPFGVWQAASPRINEDSQSHVFCFRLLEILFWWILLFHRLAEFDSESLVNYFLGHLRDSQSLMLGGNGFPPDPLQPQQNFLSVDVEISVR